MKVKLDKSDWQELYYAVLDKGNAIAQGKYGEDGLDGVDNALWAGQLYSIAKRIGPDGKLAAKTGVDPSDE